ncbi:M56 family metallopeptidase [Algoriphagus aestuariicola]|nr:M56 family metallopeptidase [Algoriphagus aestuariicola]
MEALLIYLLEASVCLGISLLIYRLLLSGLTFFAWNRFILLTMLILSGIIPLLRLEFFGIGNEVSEMTLPVFQVGEPGKASGTDWMSWPQLLVRIYVVGAVFVAARLVFGFMSSQKLLGQARLARFGTFWVAIHPKFVPASFFDYILMPDFHPEDVKQKQILAHESVHVKLRHSWDLLLINFAKVLFWFNPLVYLFERSLREVHEYQADRGVTAEVAPKEYATLLLQLITAKPGFQFMNNFNHFQTKKRIQMMAKSASEPLQRLRFLTLVPAVGLLLFVFSCEKEDMVPSLSVESLKTTDLLIGQADEVFDVVEQQPNPPGGMAGWNTYLSKNLKYPYQARRMGIEGTVIVVFEILKDGSIRNVEVLRGIGGGADEEAMRVVANSPKWQPGRQRDQAVVTRMRLPIRFKLGNSKSIASDLKEEMATGVKPQVTVVGYN